MPSLVVRRSASRSFRSALLGVTALLSSCGTDEFDFGVSDPAVTDAAPHAADAPSFAEDSIAGEASGPADVREETPFNDDADAGRSPRFDVTPSSDGAPRLLPPDASGTIETSADAAPAPPLCTELPWARYAPACTPIDIVPRNITASSVAALHPAAHALDRDTCTGWRSVGVPPQSVTFGVCNGAACAQLPRMTAVGLLLDVEMSGSLTIELQGATAPLAALNFFSNISTRTFTSGVQTNAYVELAAAADVPEVMRVVFNSGPPNAVVVRELTLLSCP